MTEHSTFNSNSWKQRENDSQTFLRIFLALVARMSDCYDDEGFRVG